MLDVLKLFVLWSSLSLRVLPVSGLVGTPQCVVLVVSDGWLCVLGCRGSGVVPGCRSRQMRIACLELLARGHLFPLGYSPLCTCAVKVSPVGAYPCREWVWRLGFTAMEWHCPYCIKGDVVYAKRSCVNVLSCPLLR